MVPWPCPSTIGDGRYRLIELIHASRNSLVYRAIDTALSQPDHDAVVALKIVPRRAITAEAFLARRVVHPNVIRVLDRGPIDDEHEFVVLEYVDGPTLAEAHTPMPPQKAAAIAAKVADALHAAHAAGVLHCDIKPSNVLLTSTGEPRLCDFGHSFEGEPAPGRRGTLAFMPPEQFVSGGDQVSARSDVYGAGSILYYLLTARNPHGQTIDEVEMFHRAFREVAPAGVDGDLDAVVARALARDPAARYPTCAELASDLRRWLGHLPIEWSRPSTPRRVRLFIRRRPALAIGIAGLLLAAVGTLGAAVEWARRTIDEQNRLLLSAQAHIRELEARRDQVEYAASRLFGTRLSDPNDQFLPAFVWLDWLTQSDQPPSAAVDKKQLLRGLIAGTAGPVPRLDNLIAKLTLVHMLLVENEPEDARPLLEDLESHFLPMLSTEDPLHRSIRALRACLNFQSGEAADLGKVYLDLEARGGMAATRRLLKTLMARPAPPGGKS